MKNDIQFAFNFVSKINFRLKRIRENEIIINYNIIKYIIFKKKIYIYIYI